MTLPVLVDALHKGIGVLPESEIVKVIQRRGVSFALTPSVEGKLRQAGATPGILQAVRANVRVATPSVPVASASPPVPPAAAASPKPNPAALADHNEPGWNAVAASSIEDCNAGSMKACNTLGNLYLNGRGVEEDATKASAAYRKACEGDNASGCSNLGNLYRSGSGVASDPALARQYLQEGCDMGDAWGCDRLKEMLRDEETASAARALDQPHKSDLAALVQQGSALSDNKRYAEAFPLFNQACDGGNAQGCADLGFMYEIGHGVAQDYAKALTAYTRGCDGAAALACHRLSVMYEHGEGVNPNPATARQYRQKGCSLGNTSDCELLRAR